MSDNAIAIRTNTAPTMLPTVHLKYRNVCRPALESVYHATLNERFYAALCKSLKRPVPPFNSLDSAVAKKANAFLTDYPPVLGASFK
jgi:hypothetical protein